MKNKIYHTHQLLFDYQCYENFARMPKSDQGKYCGSCQKHLVDFSGKSYFEIQTYIKANAQQKICGIFKPNQISNDALVTPPSKTSRNYNSAIASTLLSVTALLSACTTNEANQTNTSNKQNDSTSLVDTKNNITETRDTLTNPTTKDSLPKKIDPLVSKGHPKKNNSSKDNITEITTIDNNNQVVTGGIPLMDDFKNPDMEACSYVDEPALFPGGEEAMFAFIYKNLVYPPIAIEQKQQGKVFIELTVLENGKISNVIVKKGISLALDKAAIDVVKKMPNWTPGKFQKKPVASKLFIPINFLLH